MRKRDDDLTMTQTATHFGFYVSSMVANPLVVCTPNAFCHWSNLPSNLQPQAPAEGRL